MPNEFSEILEQIKFLRDKIFSLEAKNQELLEKIKDLNQSLIQELKSDKIGLYEK